MPDKAKAKVILIKKHNQATRKGFPTIPQKI